MSVTLLVATSNAQVKIGSTNYYRRGATVTLNPTTKTVTFVDVEENTILDAVSYKNLTSKAGRAFYSYQEMAVWVHQNMMFRGITLESVLGNILSIKGRPHAKDMLNVLYDDAPKVGDECITVLKGGVLLLENVSYGRIFLGDSLTACASYASLVAWLLANAYGKTVTASVSELTVTSSDADSEFDDVPCSYLDLTNNTPTDDEAPPGSDTLYYKREGSTIEIPLLKGVTRRIEGISNASEVIIISPESGSVVAIAEIYSKS